jgi:hypothetical protein
VILYLFGVAGVAAGITLLFLGMRAVMDIGGMCAEGGPYVIQATCPEGTTAATLLGFVIGLAGVFLAGWTGAAIGGRAVAVLFLAWPALFGVLGFNFLQYGLNPPGDEPGWAWGWLICGVVFEAMAFGPLLVGLWGAHAVAGGPPAGVPRASRATPGGPRLGTAILDARAARDARRPASQPPVVTAADAPGGDRAGGDRVLVDGPGGDEVLVDGLERLAALHGAGDLSDDEFARAKAELLREAGA